MANDGKPTLQDLTYQVEVECGSVDMDGVAASMMGYFPCARSVQVDGSITVFDHLERAWCLTAPRGAGERPATCLTTPPLAYEDTDEFIALLRDVRDGLPQRDKGSGVRIFVFIAPEQVERVRSNLARIFASRGALIAKALEVSEGDARRRPLLGCRNAGGMMGVFPFDVACGLGSDEVKACVQLGLAVAAQAMRQRAVRERVATDVENERYIFRCWMLKLGLIGPEYKMCRTRLLSRLDGCSSRK